MTAPSETMPIVLYDDLQARRFEPFATSRPLGEMRAGALLVRSRWEQVLGGSAAAFVSAAHLAEFGEFDAPPSLRDAVGVGTWIVNTRALPFLRDGAGVSTGPASTVIVDGRVAAVRIAEPLTTALHTALLAGTLDLASLAAADASSALPGVWLDEVWDITRHLQVLLIADIPPLAERLQCTTLGRDAGLTLVGSHPVFAEAGALVEPYTVFDTSAGPILLRRGSTVQAFTRVVGPCYVGVDSTIMADKIAASSIGDVCRVHGELSSTVFIGHANKGHDGFVGHSIVGRWVNMGAGTITSNLKNTYGTVALWTPDGIRDTGLQFLGTLFGDHAKTGIGLRLTTGCVLGTGANVMDAMPPKYVAPFGWGTRAPYETFAADKFVETAERMMARRHVELDARQAAFWRSLHAARAGADARHDRGGA